MKKLLLLFALTGVAFLAEAQSQNYHAFKFDISLGYAIPSNGSGTKAGVTYAFHPHYRLTDDFAAGLRMEGALIGYENTATGEIKVSALASYCATGEYYLASNGFRPFIGGGAGLFVLGSITSNNNTDVNVDATYSGRSFKFGVFPEVGFETGHFRLSAEYNVVGGKNSYAAAKIGFFIGGGRNDSRQSDGWRGI